MAFKRREVTAVILNRRYQMNRAAEVAVIKVHRISQAAWAPSPALQTACVTVCVKAY